MFLHRFSIPEKSGKSIPGALLLRIFYIELPVLETKKIRYNFIDILKTYAVFMMIIGHTLDAVAEAEVKADPAYHFFIMIRGLTSASFFIASGSGLYFAFQSKKNRPWYQLLGQRVGRILPILLAGYFLHLPYLSATRLLFHSQALDWRQLMQCDTLQNICYSIIILQVLLVITQRRNRVFFTALAAMVLVLAFTPMVHAWKSGPMILVQLFTHAYGSLFPLFPFAAYIFGGCALAAGLSYLRERGGLPLVRRCLGPLGLIMFGLSFIIRLPAVQQFTFRVGLITVLIAGLTFAEGLTGGLMKVVQAIGKESLVVYLIHLMIVYGSVVNPGFRQWFGSRLPALTALTVALGLATAMLALGWSWNTAKVCWPRYARLFRNALIALLVTLFILGK